MTRRSTAPPRGWRTHGVFSHERAKREAAALRKRGIRARIEPSRIWRSAYRVIRKKVRRR